MTKRTIKHKCGHRQDHSICENGYNRIISRIELTLCKNCSKAIIDLIKQGKQKEALELKHRLEGQI